MASSRAEHHLPVVGDVRSLRHPVEALGDDPARLAHLAQAEQVAVVGVAVVPDRNRELEVFVAAVRGGLAQIQIDAGGAERGTGDTEVDEPRGKTPTPRVRSIQIGFS